MDYQLFVEDGTLNRSILLSRDLDESISYLERGKSSPTTTQSIFIIEDIRQHQSLLMGQNDHFNGSNFIWTYLSALLYPFIFHKVLDKLHRAIPEHSRKYPNYGFILIWIFLNLSYLIQFINIILYWHYQPDEISFSEFFHPIAGFICIITIIAMLSARGRDDIELNPLYLCPITDVNGGSDVATYVNMIKNQDEPNLGAKRMFVFFLAIISSAIYAGLSLFNRSHLDPSGKTILAFIIIINFIESVIVMISLGIGVTILSRRQSFANFFSKVTLSHSTIPYFKLQSVENIKGWLALRTTLFTYGPQYSLDLMFSWLILINICLILRLFMVFFIRESSLNGFYLMNLYQAIVFTIFTLLILSSSLQINRIFKDISTLRAEKVYGRLSERQEENNQMLLDEIIKLIETFQSSIRFFGFSVNENFVHLVFSIIISGLSSVVTRLFEKS